MAAVHPLEKRRRHWTLATFRETKEFAGHFLAASNQARVLVLSEIQALVWILVSD